VSHAAQYNPRTDPDRPLAEGAPGPMIDKML
jgi:hypothetical protein